MTADFRENSVECRQLVLWSRKMGWKNKIIATLVAASLMAFSSLSHANGELDNVTMRVFMNPVGAPLRFI